MPASLLPSAETSPENSVLLVEDYDALAIAIGSALKKFAPEHAAQVARSLAEAETLAAAMQPSLFVMDFDPPHAGGIAFFSKMKSLYPDARVLVLAAANMREVAAEVGSAGAFHFIEKPFELAGFGAAVQALLGPWAATASESVRGTLRDLCLMDVLQLKCATGATELVSVQAPRGRSGEIHFRDGHICHAVTQNSSGTEALENMLRWQGAHFAETELPFEGPRTISRPWKIVLLDALRKVRETEELTQLLQPQKPKAVQKEAKPAKKIVVIDDTEMLLIFVEDILSSKDRKWDIITASTGIEGERLVETHLPDLVLLDYSLPDVNGDEVCRRLLANEKTAGIPIVMMSGHVFEMKEAAARFENVVAAIAKPFVSQSLVELVQKTLAEGKVRVLPSPPPDLAPATPGSPLSAVPMPEPVAIGNGKKPAPETAPSAIPSRSPELAPLAAPASRSSTSGLHLVAAENEVVVGFRLEVTSMQLTPLLKIGLLRARPSALAISLQVRSNKSPERLPLEIGFTLGPVQLNAHGRIDTIRLIPTRRPIGPRPAASASFDVGTVEDMPANALNRVQITSSGMAPMTVQLLAHFHLSAVEMSPNLEIDALIVKAREGSVRISLDSDASAREENAATFDLVSVKLDESGRLAELSLAPFD